MNNDYTNKLSSSQFGVNIFITFIFVLFFFHYFRYMFTEDTSKPYIILVNTILFMLWYCFSFLYALK